VASNPNILLIMVDQFAVPALEASGGRIAKTPDLNPLAEAHSFFGTHYCDFPICALI
jgi:arylsulfatase A-like enzyme